MDNVKKIRVLLQHWIDHNQGHAAEFSKWEKLMAEDDKENVACYIGEAVKAVQKANELLSKALLEAGGPIEDANGEHHHDHHHH